MSKVLWKPLNNDITNIELFIKSINQKYSVDLKKYSDLHTWSINNISNFWRDVWEDTNIIYSKKYSAIIDNESKIPGAIWFKSSRLNFAENLLRNNSNKIAIEFYGENIVNKKISYKKLNNLVSKVSYSFKKMGVVPGDRIVAVMPNIPETVICMLAASSLGAIWSSCSTDFGIKGILDRFTQIKPKILITTNGYYFKGKVFDIKNKIDAIFNEISSIKNLIMIDYVNSSINKNCITWNDLINNDAKDITFQQLPFNHPLYVMYSSGTTGKPKSIVHSAGGTLIQHLKELKYHVNLKEDDKIFYYTTCGWMMWNWLISALALNSTIVLYDGNPFYPNSKYLLKLMGKINITIFGTSAKYISTLNDMKIIPKMISNFKSLKMILSTGSPLSDDSFEYVYKQWKKDVQLSSISGGTDIISCFALGNPILPVYKGELQCLGLGMSVKSYDEKGHHKLNCKGELICDKAFPSMPTYFWNDDDNIKFNNAYFNKYNNVWTHGDFISINKRGGVKIFGRSDTTLNPGGIRIGTSEIYEVLDKISFIQDSLVIGQRVKEDERIVLFIKLNNSIVVTKNMKAIISEKIKSSCSGKHVPSIILAIQDIPYTINGKKVELAVKNIINGIEAKNKSVLANPSSLNLFKNIKELKIS